MTGPEEDRDPIAIPPDDDGLLAECRVETFRAGGPGGQHQNKAETGVRLVHLPTGVRSTARDERSQHRNRVLALSRLRAKLQEMNQRVEPRLATKVPRASKERRLDEKKRRSRKKRLRKPPEEAD